MAPNGPQVNPNLRVRYYRTEGRVTGLSTFAPVRGRGLLCADFDAHTHGELLPILLDLLSPGAAFASLSPAHASDLAAVGVLIDAEQISQDVQFEVRLEEEEASAARSDRKPVGHADRRIRSTFWFQESDALPAAFADAPPVHLPQSGMPTGQVSATRPIVWHQGSSDEPILPWWPGERLLSVLRTLAEGHRFPRSVPHAPPDTLCGIGMIGTPEEAERLDRRWRDRTASARREFSARGCTRLPRVLPQRHVAALRDYHLRLIAEGWLKLGDTQSTRHYCHNDPVDRLLQWALKPTIEAIVGRSLKPSYAYFAGYVAGAEVLPHRDRAQCHFTVSLLVEHDRKTCVAAPWPLFIVPRGQCEPEALWQSPGDLILFAGTELTHFREPLRAARTSSSVLLHYVPEEFNGPLD